MNVTGDPAQQNRTAIFGHDYSYPATNNPINWETYPHSGAGSFSLPSVTGYNLQVNGSPTLGNFSFTSSDKLPHPAQFNFSPNVCQQEQEYNRSLVRCKRKTESPPAQIVKQHITEEKMAEHMSKLHISSETVPTPCEPDSIRERRLYMCEEMRRLQTESILPQALLSRIQRPCTALVLWTPPPRMPATQSLNNNNEEDEPDNNHMDLDCNM